jgi:hypothetical protein
MNAARPQRWATITGIASAGALLAVAVLRNQHIRDPSA